MTDEHIGHLDILRTAIEQFVGATHKATNSCDSTPLVTQALLVYEAVCISDDGDTQRTIAYATPTDNWSLSGGLGLIEAARFYIRQDCLAGDEID